MQSTTKNKRRVLQLNTSVSQQKNANDFYAIGSGTCTVFLKLMNKCSRHVWQFKRHVMLANSDVEAYIQNSSIYLQLAVTNRPPL